MVSFKFNSKEQSIIIYTLILCVFWGLGIIPRIFNLIFIASLPLVVFALTNKQKNLIFKKYILLIFISLFINAISCYYFRGQSLFLSFRTENFINFLPILFYFFLIKKNPSLNSLNKIISFLYLLFCICYIVQYSILPNSIFRLYNFTESERRFRLCGQLILALGYFQALNIYILTKNKFNLLLVVLGFSIYIMLGFRTMLVALLCCSFLMIIKIEKITLKKAITYLLMLTIIAVILLQFSFTENTITSIINRSETNNFDNEDYIRYQQLHYFTNEHFINNIERFWGSGFYHEKSDYGKMMSGLHTYDKYGNIKSSIAMWVDWGLLGLSWIAGIPTVILIITISLLAFLKKKPKEYLYLSYFYLFLLLCSVTTTEWFREGAFVFHAIALYCIEIISKKQINKEQIRQN